MEKRVTFVFTMLISLAVHVVFAQPDLSKTKFYRAKNYSTARYMTVKDDKGEINTSKGIYDFGAIVPVLSYEDVLCDPGSVILVEESSPLSYYLNAQGTGTKQIVNLPVKLQTVVGYEGAFGVYAQTTVKKGGISAAVSAYLCDLGGENGIYWCSLNDIETKNGLWQILPVSNDTENYFAAKPEIYANGKYYTTLYASFGYSLGPNTTAYFVKEVSADGTLSLGKINPGGLVPPEAAVILECSDNLPENNKLLPSDYSGKLSTNILKGVYFNNTAEKHVNQTAYNPSTMRVLTVNAQGQIVLGKSTDSYLAANKAYLEVPAGSPDEFSLPLASATGISEVTVKERDDSRVYDLMGREVKGTTRGVYLKGGKKFVVK